MSYNKVLFNLGGHFLGLLGQTFPYPVIFRSLSNSTCSFNLTDILVRTSTLKSLHLGLYFRAELVDKADTPWYFKAAWKQAFKDLADKWPNVTCADELPASRLGTMLLTRYLQNLDQSENGRCKRPEIEMVKMSVISETDDKKKKNGRADCSLIFSFFNCTVFKCPMSDQCVIMCNFF